MKPVNTQTIFITGATDGIGKLAAIELAKQKAHLLIHGRNENKVAIVVAEIKKTRLTIMLKVLLQICHRLKKFAT